MLTQTFEGLMQALIAQRERNAEFMRESALSPEAFAAACITSEMAREELFKRFGKTEDGASPVDVGRPYVPPTSGTAEEPPILKLCGISFGEGDYESSPSRSQLTEFRKIPFYTITAVGAQRVADAVVSQLAVETLEKLRMLVAQGLPEIRVDSGRILTKANFRMDESAVKNSYGTKQMLVRPPSLSGPEGFRMRVGMSGEMEIKFSVIRSECNG
ncbi:MAG: hypothetical protein FWD46_02520 [Cystobacterineae bacterium]|nr:hypothetical protein [Cystobacterineae bacterium]